METYQERLELREVLILVAFAGLFAALSPIYYLNRWDFKRKKKLNPFYTSKLVRLQERYPFLYEIAMLAQNFPVPRHVYKVLPEFSGDVLQVGCGTGLLNKYFRQRPEIRLTNMDPNLNALRFGVRWKRFSNFVHGAIDKHTDLPDKSFDVILFARSFHHVRRHKVAFQECARLLRDNGKAIIADPVILNEDESGARPTGYMGNSSIDGVIWRFSRVTLVKHIEQSLPATLAISSVKFDRQLHVTNYNLFVPQTDAIVILEKRSS